ncbi:hypothetical protein [Tropicibacter naphthalenivorans]|uniref:Uncharacterized protein n=1 Tax=Tropicibacter naphthalenivorans TaxID=441103 RepID=A0A0P1GUS9_9RHOB|nr:hypothetical protein [Tropicibacter naphthalenivorans]CUH79387.1 hypothetical protein TRN7648_02445 [Tropicibacter naphthalenivorans]SMC71840.1 hypothetical protein SAMN04488093_10375 [Tropicibacter naphthalenivorans]
MFRTIGLLLPALIPSWRFFKTVAPSPRIHYRLDGGDWQPVRPRPQSVSFARMMRRMLWNPRRNEELFLVTLSERLVEAPNAFCVNEINARVARIVGAPRGASLQFRLTFITREEGQIVNYDLFQSEPWVLP